MKIKPFGLALMLILLAALIPACAASTPLASVGGVIATATKGNTSVPMVTFTPVSTATFTPIPATFTPAATSTPKAFPTVPAGLLKQEVYMGLGSGGPGGTEDICENSAYMPPAGTALPMIKSAGGDSMIRELGSMCIYGIPLNGMVNLALYDPDNKFVSQVDFKIVSGKNGNEMVHVPNGSEDLGILGSAFTTKGIPIMHLGLWVPAGLPAGKWGAVVKYGSAQFKGEFVVYKRSGDSISFGPEQINPFDKTRYCYYPFSGKESGFSVGQTVYIYGTNFKPNTETPVGIYYLTGKNDPAKGQIAQLSKSMMVKPDSQGNFKAWQLIDNSFKPGTYTDGTHYCFKVK